MNNRTHLGRGLVAAAGALALSGAGLAVASTPPTDPPDDTTAASEPATDMTASTMDMATDASMAGGSMPMAGAGPSDCPAIPSESTGTEPAAPDASEAVEATAPAASAPADTGAGSAPAGSAPAGTTEGSAAPTDSEAPGSGPFVQIAESAEYGPILVDGDCRTLYGFTPDADGEPTCIDDCASAWPPLFVTEDAVPPLADELDPSLFSVVEHPEGAMLKVGDWPLYYFASDAAPGDVLGQGVGGVWFVVSPDGTLVEGDDGGTGTSMAPMDTTSDDGSMAPTGTDPVDTATATSAA